MARRSDHSRDEIHEMALLAAERLLETEGAGGLSTRKVATEIGYTVGTLYLVFENLDDLVLQINGRTLDRLYDTLIQATKDCADPQHCIEAMAHAYIEFAIAHRKRWQLVFEHVVTGDGPLPGDYQSKVQRMFDLVESQLNALLGVKASLQAANAARALWCGVHGVCSLAISQKLEVTGVKSVQSLTDTLVDNFLRGLTAKRK